MITFNHVSFGYDPKLLLYNDLNLQLNPGHIYGLLGKNGAGKSTLLRLICGLRFPTAGEISVNGHTPKQRKVPFLSDIFLIPEDVQLPKISIRDYAKTYGVFYPNFSETAFYRHLEELEISEQQSIKNLSFGQQKKVMIAFALATNVRVLIMDEPTNGLDIPSKSQFRKMIAATLTDEKTFIISTHQVRDLDNLIDSVLIVNNGSLFLNDSLENIAQRISTKVITKNQLDENVLYAEETLQGYAAVLKNATDENTKVNLELLFNAAMANPQTLLPILNAQNHESYV